MGDSYEQLQADKIKLEAAASTGGHLAKTQLQRVWVCLSIQYLAVIQVEKKLVETRKEYEEEEEK